MKALTILVAGVVTIGLATALTLPGRQTVGVIGATGTATKGVLGTAISGK
jgi:hypothetical protein